MTRQLLAFSRKQVFKLQKLDLDQVVLGMDKMLQRVIGEDVDLITKCTQKLDPVTCDPGQVEQIIVNLAVNARDAMPHGGKLTIETDNIVLDEEYVQTHAEAQPGPHVMLAVTDTGVGMDEETRSRIFEPFFTTKELGRGTGLGLATAYGIVKQSGGIIWVYSEVGHGTTFKIYLPISREGAAATKPRTMEPTLPSGTETILVVEDDPSVLSVVVRVLESSGYKVLQAMSTDEAMERAEAYEEPIDLLLTDVILSGIGGPQLAEFLVQQRTNMKVLFMSGYTDDAIVHHGVLEQGAAFLEKPIRPTTLLHAVRAALASENSGASR